MLQVQKQSGNFPNPAIHQEMVNTNRRMTEVRTKGTSDFMIGRIVRARISLLDPRTHHAIIVTAQLVNIRWADLQMDSGGTKCRTCVPAVLAKATIAFWAIAVFQPVEIAHAKTPVTIELVLAIDTSISVDNFEFDLMMEGIARAFRNPAVIELIDAMDGIAVALFQWNSSVDEQYVIHWHLLTDQASIQSFASKVENAKRDPKLGFTAIGDAIDFGVRMIDNNAFEGRQLKIDISGDGPNNTGVPLELPHRTAGALGVVINGLPIITYTAARPRDIETYYQEEVIFGPGAFVEIANDYEDFSRAFLRKLLREISPLVAQEDTATQRIIHEANAGQLKAD